MKLYEFFGNINFDQEKGRDSKSLSKEEEQELGDDVFYYILDDDDLHKKYFMPVAKELKAKYDDTSDDASHDWKVWSPMVKSGCARYYKEHELKKHPEDVFTKEFRKDICKRLESHYRESISRDKSDS
jgi:hypothetical protein